MRMWSCHHRQSRSSCQYLGPTRWLPLFANSARRSWRRIHCRRTFSTDSFWMHAVQRASHASIAKRANECLLLGLAASSESQQFHSQALARKRAFLVRLHRASVSLDEIEWAVPGATTADVYLHENRWRRSVSPAVLLCCTCLRQSRCTRSLRSRRSPLPSTCLRMQSRR